MEISSVDAKGDAKDVTVIVSTSENQNTKSMALLKKKLKIMREIALERRSREKAAKKNENKKKPFKIKLSNVTKPAPGKLESMKNEPIKTTPKSTNMHTLPSTSRCTSESVLTVEVKVKEVKKNTKKSKTKMRNSDAENERKRMLARERKRKQRAKIREDPEAYERKKIKDRERYYKNKEQGKVKPIAELSKREQRRKRKMWRKNNRNYYYKKKLENEKDSEKVTSIKVQLGRKKVLTTRSRTRRSLIKEQNERLRQEKLANKWKLRYFRLKKKKKNTEPPTKRVEEIMQRGSTQDIKRRLLIGEVLTEQIKQNKTVCTTTQQQEILSSCVSGPLIKKYKLIEATKSLATKYYQRKFTSKAKIININRRQRACLTMRLKKQVHAFLENDSNSICTPGKKDKTAKDGTVKQKRYLTDSLLNLYKKFKQENDNIKISYTTFTRLRPFWVTFPSFTGRDTCLCIKHANFGFLLRVLSQYRIIKNASSLQKLSEQLCCSNTARLCMYGECSHCKIKNISATFEFVSPNSTLHYFQWANTTETRIIKGTEKKVKVMKKERQRTTAEELVIKMKDETNKMLQHSYRVNHQGQFLKNLKHNLAENEVCLVIDFSENYTLKYADEVQSVHFGASKVQISLHTGAYYYKDGEETKCQTFCTVSMCLRHDPSAVWANILPILTDIQRNHPNIDNFHFMSDGPTTQYRNKKNFFLFVHYSMQLGFSHSSWNFFESGHGKSVADGVGGVVKRTADSEVAKGNDIASIEQFIETANKNLKKTKIYQVNEENILTIDAVLEQKNIKPIPNTMQLHQVTWNEANRNILNLRELSCSHCKECCLHNSLFPNQYQIYGVVPNRILFYIIYLCGCVEFLLLELNFSLT